MIHYIENDKLTVGVKEFGCELTSIISKESGYEFMWQGNPDIWSGQSPILFPIVGRLIDDKYILEGKEYEMPKHGFARKLQWTFLESDGTSMKFVLSDSEETFKLYPYHFDLVVTYTLDKNVLRVSHDIFNKNDGTMLFSLGAHPAFNCKIGDKLVFEKKETLSTVKIDLANSLRLPDTVPVLNNETDIVITEDVFNGDALIFSGVKSEYITLRSDDHNRTVKFTLGGAPWLGIWAKPGAPYVCIEPWCGVNDSQIKKNDFSEKDGINAIAKGESWNFTWSAEFSE
jgi:galactose mutarotase-like enzyme